MSITGQDSTRQVARVAILGAPFRDAFDYAAPSSAIEVGSLVRVPFGSRHALGVLWQYASSAPQRNLKTLEREMQCPVPPLPEGFRAFLESCALYTMTSRGALLHAVYAPLLRAKHSLRPPPRPNFVQLTEKGRLAAGQVQRSKARAALLQTLSEQGGQQRDALRAQGIGSAVLRSAQALELIALIEAPFEPNRLPSPLPLNDRQVQAARELEGLCRAGGFTTTLLDGQTGSGKTEVYFEAIQACLQQKRQVILMLPEIALSMRFVERFARRFGFVPLSYHSNLSPSERAGVWHALASGTAQAVVGARSSLFLPCANLGLVIVDEEHDSAYKQEEGIVYHARDMAVLRAQKTPCPVLLVSATPSLESWHHARAGKYRHVVLPDRIGRAVMPRVELVDIVSNPPPDREHFLSPRLRACIAETLAKDEQVLIFLNRRGYAPLLLCRACALRLRCRACSAWLVEHRRLGRALCHHCGFSVSLPESCPSCGLSRPWKACGPGIERLEEELSLCFPLARLLALSSDTPEPHRVIEAVEQRACDILLGTQMLSKGYHFPFLTLVGIVDADLGLSGGDLRAFERCYQLLHQVGGRAGRADRPGRVVVQTSVPHSETMRALASFDRDGFFERECALRREYSWPPFSRLAAVIVSARCQSAVDRFAHAMDCASPSMRGIECFGPALAPLSYLRGRHRRRFLVRSCAGGLQGFLRAWMAALPRREKDIRVKIDIDPHTFV